MIVGPRGETLAAGGEGQQLLTAEMELAPLVDYRQQFPGLLSPSDLLGDEFFVKECSGRGTSLGGSTEAYDCPQSR